MEKMNTSRYYRHLPFLSMLYICIIICATLGVNKTISLGTSYTQAGTIIFPLFFIFSDIIAEVYGYKVAKKLLNSALASYLIFSLICYLMLKLPSYPLNEASGYQFVFFNILRITLSTVVSLYWAILLNSYLLTKWKFLVKGKYFWLRSIGSSTIGEFIYTFSCILMTNLGVHPIKVILVIIFWAYLFKVIYTLVFIYPATFFTNVLKLSENLDVCDNIETFNPFKLQD